MSRLRRYLVPALLITAIVFVCGKLLLTPIGGERKSPRSVALNEFKYGWPWTFMQCFPTFDPQSQTYRPGEINEFYWKWLLADIAMFLTVLALVGILSMLQWRRSGYAFRFSIRGLLLLVAIVAAIMGWWMISHRSWSREQELLQKFEGPFSASETAYCGPEWLRRLWPVEKLALFIRVTAVDTNGGLSEEEADEVLAGWREMPFVRKLTIGSLIPGPDQETQRVLITPSRLADTASFQQVEEIWFSGNDSANDDTLKVISRLSGLQIVDLAGCRITDNGLSYLVRCRALGYINLSHTKITDAGVAYLATLPSLYKLELKGTAITDLAIDTLAQMKSLANLDISDCPAITDRGVRRLLELPCLTYVALPDPPQISASTEQLFKERNEKRLLELQAKQGGGFF